jgi:hypothetical protein
MTPHDTAFEAFMLAMHQNGTSGLAMRKNLKVYMDTLLDSPEMVEDCVSAYEKRYDAAYARDTNEDYVKAVIAAIKRKVGI